MAGYSRVATDFVVQRAVRGEDALAFANCGQHGNVLRRETLA